MECWRREASSETKPERNARCRPQTEARRSCGKLQMPARDERTGLRSGSGVVERGTGPTGSPWSGANRALVTAEGKSLVVQTAEMRSRIRSSALARSSEPPSFKRARRGCLRRGMLVYGFPKDRIQNQVHQCGSS